ncbi:hypothetical protein GQR36_17835 [Enterococcus termitis]
MRKNEKRRFKVCVKNEHCSYDRGMYVFFLEDHDIFVGIIGIKKLMLVVEYAIENRDYDIVDRLFDEIGAIVHSRRQLVDYANYNDSESLKTVFLKAIRGG